MCKMTVSSSVRAAAEIREQHGYLCTPSLSSAKHATLSRNFCTEGMYARVQAHSATYFKLSILRFLRYFPAAAF
jgi:hypothetical protein